MLKLYLSASMLLAVGCGFSTQPDSTKARNLAFVSEIVEELRVYKETRDEMPADLSQLQLEREYSNVAYFPEGIRDAQGHVWYITLLDPNLPSLAFVGNLEKSDIIDRRHLQEEAAVPR